MTGLLSGSGAGFAKAAELNGYPGPAHVLELAGPLQLNAEQELATRSLLTAHKARAQSLGVEMIAAERELDNSSHRSRPIRLPSIGPRSRSGCCRRGCASNT